MHDEYKNLVYLNNERLKFANSKEYFWGKKLLKYVSLIKKIKIRRLFVELSHDVYAFLNKDNSNNKILDFSANNIKIFDNKVIVYTCIYGNYDEILEPLCIDDNCIYYIFTDRSIPADSVWIKGDESLFPDECDTPAKRNRYVKMFPHLFFSCDYSIYLDGNLQIVGHPSRLVQHSLLDCKTGISMHLSPRENCIYEEADTAYFLGKITKKERNQVKKMYSKNNMPRHFGMFECNVIVRDHNNSNMPIIMDFWWEQYKNGVKRDQLYFTYSLFKLGYYFADVLNFGSSVNDNALFLRKEHI